MRIKKIFPSARYVASGFEIVLCLIMFLSLVVASVVLFGKIKEVPAFPRDLIFENAFIYKEVSQSRSTSYLYLRVGLEEGAYDYAIEAFSQDVRGLDLKRSKKLLVAVDSDRNKRFVWGVHDEGGALLISSQKILEWEKHYRFGLCFLIFAWSAVSLYFLLVIVRHGIWSRIAEKRVVHENRTD